MGDEASGTSVCWTNGACNLCKFLVSRSIHKLNCCFNGLGDDILLLLLCCWKERQLRRRELLLATCSGLPFVWRFMQCLRQYNDTGYKSHVLNAMKYLASLVVIFFSVMDNIARGGEDDVWTVYRTLWLMSIIVSSSYSYIWDIYMDWGLCKYSLKHFLLRDTLMFERPWLYYIAMVTNLVMRLTWTITISPLTFGITLSREILLCILSSVEVLRRIQWNFFRIENEHVNNLVRHKIIKQSSYSKNNVLKI